MVTVKSIFQRWKLCSFIIIYSRWKLFGNIREKDNFKKLYRFIISTPFYSYLEDAKEEYIVDFDYWFNSCTSASYGHVMSKFFESCAHKKGKIIFGDKTPSYIYIQFLL